MSEQRIRFEDGESYERMMGTWSRLVGVEFLNWLAPPCGLKWLDVGCGNGAFTELLVERYAPVEVHGIDPSEGQLAFARRRPAARIAEFRQGNAMELPFPESRFDAAVMALVIFYVPEPAKGVAEMARVVRPGGTISAYAWDFMNDGSPTGPIQVQQRAMGFTTLTAPNADVSRLEVLRELWADAGLEGIGAREIVVGRTFANFEDLWTTTLLMPNIGPLLAKLTADDAARLKAGVQQQLQPDSAGRVTYSARANAITGRVPN